MNAYPAPVDRLLTLGRPDFKELADYSQLGIGAQHVPELIRVCPLDPRDPRPTRSRSSRGARTRVSATHDVGVRSLQRQWQSKRLSRQYAVVRIIRTVLVSIEDGGGRRR